MLLSFIPIPQRTKEKKELEIVKSPWIMLHSKILGILELKTEGCISLSRIEQEIQKTNLKFNDVYQLLHNLLQEGYLYQLTNNDFYEISQVSDRKDNCKRRKMNVKYQEVYQCPKEGF